LTVAVGALLAHEGHKPLPSKGARVDQEKGLITLSHDARVALDVQAVEIGTTAPPDTVLAYATLVEHWKSHAYAVSRLSGRIVSLRGKPGERVEVGQILAEVQSQELEQLRQEIQTNHIKTMLAEQVAKLLKDSRGAIPERDIIEAEIQFQQARHTLDLAKMKWLALGMLKEDLDAILSGSSQKVTFGLPIRSPVRGTVIHADLTVGKVIEAGEHLFEIIDLSTIWAKVGVLEKDITRITAGLPVEVRLTAYPGEPFRGTVAVVGQFLSPDTHLNDVWVEFRNPDGKEPRLLPGMYGQARIELPVATSTKVVPFTALINDGVDRFVLIEDASTSKVSEFRKKSVVVLRETPDVVVVRSPDLFPGDRVVTRGGHELGTFFASGVLRLTQESTRTIGVEVAPAAMQSVKKVVEVPGAVDLPPDRRSVSTSRLAGTVLSIRVNRGQRVQANEVLAEVFSLDLLNLQLDMLREQLAVDLATQQLAQLNLVKSAVPKRRLMEADAAFVSASNRRDGARRLLEMVGISSDQVDALLKRREVVPSVPVRATVAGTVISFNKVIGQSVRADESLFEIHDLTRPWVQGFVSEQELTQVRIGQTARVRLIGNPGVVLKGKVARSGRTFGSSDRILSVWVELHSDPLTPLRHNQMARLTLDVASNPPTLAVPLGAIYREGIQSFVFVRQGGIFERRAVTLGRKDDHRAEITAGLKAGEIIAVSGADELNTAWASVR